MSKIEEKLENPGIERSILSGILINGSDTLIDINDLIDSQAFSSQANRKIFDVLKYMVIEKEIKKFDISTILSVSKVIVNKITNNNQDYEYLEALFASGPSKENIIILAGALYKLYIARRGIECLRKAALELSETTTEDPVDKIIATVENPIFNFTNNVVSNSLEMQPIGQDFDKIMEEKIKNPDNAIGLSTCFQKWDNAIGGGLMKGTISVIGGRPKSGKSFYCLNVAYSIAERGIPVLYLDTELTREIQMDRIVSMITKVDLENIRHGKFTDEEYQAVVSCKDKIHHMPIMHQSIAGQSVQSITSICRRWLSKCVGFGENGNVNPCLVVYDYIKLMDSSDIKNMQEHQMLGFLMTGLHNFTVRWGLPMLAATQINRDGVEKEGGHVIAASDRILALCSNFTILKYKLQEELADDPSTNGTMKLIVTDTRFGPGMERGEYINIKDKRKYATFEEGAKCFDILQESAFNGNEQTTS